MEIIATPTHPKANSYAFWDEIEDYFQIYDWWQSLTQTQKENLAVLATAAIDALPFSGRKLVIGQRLEFPRMGHPSLELTGSFLLWLSSQTQDAFTVTDDNTTTVSFDLNFFPATLVISYFIGGSQYSVEMAPDGSISGGNVSGNCDLSTGHVDLTFTSPLDNGSVIQCRGSGYSRYTLQHHLLVFDPEEFADDFLKYGFVRVFYDDSVFLTSITANAVIPGTVSLADPLPQLPEATDSATVYYPVFNDVKQAQFIQMAYLATKSGTFPQEGIRSIRIGDTQVVFSDRLAGYSRYTRLASRYGLHPAAFTKLLPYTIYAQSVEIGS